MTEWPRYALFGLIAASELALPELIPASADAAPDLVIRRGKAVSPVLAPGLVGNAARALLIVADVGLFDVRGGREVIVSPYPGVPEAQVRLFLLGSAMGVVLHQRGLLPLHANAVEIGGQAVAFTGHSGAGKSTLAAWFHDRGARVLSDDVCVVELDAEGRAIANPGLPRMRLWRDALHRSGRDPGQFQPTWASDSTYDKFDVPIAAAATAAEPIALKAIYLLRNRAGGFAINRLTGAAAAGALISNTYRGSFIATVGDSAAHWRQCVALAAAVPVFEVARPFDPDGFDQQALGIESHVRGVSTARLP